MSTATESPRKVPLNPWNIQLLATTTESVEFIAAFTADNIDYKYGISAALNAWVSSSVHVLHALLLDLSCAISTIPTRISLKLMFLYHPSIPTQ